MAPNIISPVVAGHRGFKGKYVENTFHGFEKCYEAGAPLIETDLWITTDNRVVVSHDVNTKRLFETQDGQATDFDILESSYERDLKDLRIIGSHENLHLFKDLLSWFAQHVASKEQSSAVPGQFCRIMLDIKRPNPPKILKVMIKDMLAVKNDMLFWTDRLLLGIWDLKFIKYLNQQTVFREIFEEQKRHMDIVNISVSWMDSLHYLEYNAYVDALTDKDAQFRFKITTVSLLYLLTWLKDFLTRFMPLLKLQDLKLYLWTINNTMQFDYLWKVGRVYKLKEYGIISDDPAKMVSHKRECDKAVPSERTSLNPEAITFTLTQRLTHFLLAVFLGGGKRVTAEELRFDGFVDEEESVRPKVSKISMWVFATCQRLGIF